MAGYTAANNIFGFLVCYSECSDTGLHEFYQSELVVRKWKRMDRVLIDCLILSFVAMMILGNSAYFFGPKLLTIYTSNSKVIQCEWKSCYIQRLRISPLWIYGSVSEHFVEWAFCVPMILSIIGTVGTRIVWIFWIFPNYMDILFISYPASWIITIVLQVICYYL